MGVMGASDSSLLVVHSVDSPDDFGEVCSGCDCCAGEGRSESCGISFGSAGIGSSGWEVAVVGMGLGMVTVEVAMCLRGVR